MRKITACLATACLTGCGSLMPGDHKPRAKPDKTLTPIVTPARRLQGKVVRIHTRLRFVVLDFSLDGLPSTGRVLGIYRLGARIGTVRVSGPSWETHTVADILTGEIWVGDEVRLD